MSSSTLPIFVEMENLPFTKYPKVCELEARHGVRVGMSYVNENAGKELIHYIAESRRQELKQKLANAKFFSLLLDGSTDTGNIDNELLLIVWCDRDGSDEKVHTRMEYFTVVRPHSVTAQGLLKVLERGLQGALTSLLKTLKETDKLATKPLDQWPTYVTTVRKCTDEEGHTVYQYQRLKKYSEAQELLLFKV